MKRSKTPDDGKQNAKVHTDIKPEFARRPEQYPATRDGGDNIDAHPIRKP